MNRPLMPKGIPANHVWVPVASLQESLDALQYLYHALAGTQPLLTAQEFDLEARSKVTHTLYFQADTDFSMLSK